LLRKGPNTEKASIFLAERRRWKRAEGREFSSVRASMKARRKGPLVRPQKRKFLGVKGKSCGMNRRVLDAKYNEGQKRFTKGRSAK